MVIVMMPLDSDSVRLGFVTVGMGPLSCHRGVVAADGMRQGMR